jgi:hypothetical protein
MTPTARTLLTALGLLMSPPAFGQTSSPTPTAADIGTATIHGRVIAGDSGQPVRRAQVQLLATDSRIGRMVTTDPVGRYEITGVPAGRYLLRASKAPYLDGWYGQMRADESGRPLDVRDDQTLEVDIALPKGAVVAGRVVDEFGDAAEDARVTLLRADRTNVSNVTTSGGPTGVTDDVGAFRLFGLAPGEYVLSAAPSSRIVGPPLDAGERAQYATTYFPSTTLPGQAEVFTIAAGQTIGDMLITLVPGRSARIMGTAVDSGGRPMSGQVIATSRGENFPGSDGLVRGSIRPDGTFTLDAPTTGRYLLQAVNRTGDERAIAESVVSGADVEGVRLVGVKAVTASGRVVREPAMTLAATGLRSLGIVPSPADDDGAVALSMFAGPTPINEDGTFETRAWPGRVHLNVFASEEWIVRTVRHRGVDVTDRGIDFIPNENISEIEIELTNRVAEVIGTVTDSRGRRATDYSVLVFPEDPERRALTPRYVRSGRPDQHGEFRVGHLPTGAYRAIALDRLDDEQPRDVEFLGRLAAAATPFTLGEGESKRIGLQLHVLPK